MSILDEKGNDGQNLLAVMELYAPVTYPGKGQRRNHVLITVYEKSSLPEYVGMTAEKGRVLHIRNGVSHETVASLQLAGTESQETLKRNVAQFRKIVNAFKEKNKINYSFRDTRGRELSAQQQEYFKDSKIRDEQGRLMVMYHGTPNGQHTTFRSGSYFTPEKRWADVYQSPGASSISVKKDASHPKTYEVYLDIQRPFDTRNPKERKIFMEEYYRQWGTDGMDLREFIEEMGYDYDGLILDEGAVGGYGDEVVSRGLSYVTFRSEQVKNVDDQTPTRDPDIRRSRRDQVTKRTAEALKKENAELREDVWADWSRSLTRRTGDVRSCTPKSRLPDPSGTLPGTTSAPVPTVPDAGPDRRICSAIRSLSHCSPAPPGNPASEVPDSPLLSVLAWSVPPVSFLLLWLILGAVSTVGVAVAGGIATSLSLLAMTFSVFAISCFGGRVTKKNLFDREFFCDRMWI